MKLTWGWVIVKGTRVSLSFASLASVWDRVRGREAGHTRMLLHFFNCRDVTAVVSGVEELPV